MSGLEESSLSAGVWMGAQQIPGSLGVLWSSLCLEMQVGASTLLRPAPRLCLTMPADAVCGPAGRQPRAQGCGSRWERQVPKAPRMETWAGLLGMEPWSHMHLDWTTGGELHFLGQAESVDTHFSWHCTLLPHSCPVLGKLGFLRCHKPSWGWKKPPC